jgi:sugar-specific transcriptional regulator TrmB
MDINILMDLGFTRAEAIVYLKLLHLGAVKVGVLIEKTGLQSSTIHNTLNSLVDKGFVNYILRGKIKIYQAIEPKIVLKNFKEKEQRFEQLIPELEEKRRLATQKTKAELYDGVRGVMTMLDNFIENTESGDYFYFFSVDVGGINKEIQKFFERFDAKRKARGLKVRGLARKKLKPYYDKRKVPKMRYLDFPIPTNISMCNNKIVLITWGDKPSGVLIESPQLYESQVSFFNELWKTATP